MGVLNFPHPRIREPGTHTKAGHAFCDFYALVGIPLNVVFLNSLGRGLCTQLATPEKWKEWPLRSQVGPPAPAAPVQWQG